MSWTPERTELLKKLWAEGVSAGRVAKELGGCTRNAVIGKAARLGLPPHSFAVKVANHRRAKLHNPTRSAQRLIIAGKNQVRVAKTPPPPKPDGVEALRLSMAADEGPGLCTIHTLGSRMCRWPIGDPSSDAFTYCGRETGEKASYCGAHAQRAHAPAETKKKTSVAELARSLRRYV